MTGTTTLALVSGNEIALLKSLGFTSVPVVTWYGIVTLSTPGVAAADALHSQPGPPE